MDKYEFDHALAFECARSFSVSTGLGCTVSDISGKILYSCGCCVGNCPLADTTGISHADCIRAHNYGMTEAERFGGKYIYFCPLGLTCFVSPIIGEEGSMAKITVGPFLMVELQDFIDCELTENLHLEDAQKEKVIGLLRQIPQVEPQRVQDLSVLLFLTVGFMNNVAAENRLIEQERADLLQGQIGAYIYEVKNQTNMMRYPFEKERAFLQSLTQRDMPAARRQLKELLALLFAQKGSNGEWIRTRAGELLALVSRTAVEQGAGEEQTLLWLERCQQTLPAITGFQKLSVWLYETVIGFVEGLFDYPDAKHANLIHRCIQHISAHYNEHLTLEDTAAALSHSPDYLSRIFKQETGMPFNQYLNNLRITKAKELIRYSDLRLTDISHMVGYDDQSYFTKVFKRTTGMSPSDYHKKFQRKNGPG